MSLIEKGYLRKERDPLDRRANRIHLTEMANERKETIQTLLRQWSGYLTEGLDEATVSSMYKALESMAEKVSAADFHREWGA